MIIIKLIGGLGNQLFQYAVGRHLAEINKTELKLDITAFEEYKLHSFSMFPFNIPQNFATKEEVAHFKKYQRRSGRKWFIYNKLIANPKKYFQERQFHFDPYILTLKDNVYLDGYWQTEKYFKGIENIIRKELMLKIPLSSKSQEVRNEIQSSNSISMHIRRADYVKDKETLKYFGSCSLDYYKKAVEIISSKITNPHFFIFSDDHAWVKENIKLNFPTTYVDHNNADKNYEDLILMSTCKNNIIANSTFSWWGAWLNQNPSKIVIGPEKWFNQVKSNIKTHDVIPETWIKI